jgi:hypothetical protein
VTLRDVQEHLVRYLCDLESQQHGWVVPYLAFVKACYFDHMVAFLPAYAATRSLAWVSMSGASEALELEQWAEDGTWLLMIVASLVQRFCNFDSAVDSCCQASSDSFAIVLPSEGNCPLYWLIPACLALQASLVCEGHCHHTETAWHVEGPEAAVTYVVVGLSLVVVDGEKFLEVTSMLNCYCSNHLHGIEKRP